MPTIPPSSPRLSENDPYRQRQVAESFGADAERYDRTRPSYPDAMIERIVAASPGTELLDVGAGTGIASRLFRAAGCSVLGVEPDPRMADLARHQGFDMEVATFEEWEPAGRTFDTLAAAQAWHWVDPVAGAVKASEVLRSGGLFAAFWNAFSPAPEIGEAFADVYRRVMPDSPVYQRGMAGPDSYSRLCARAGDALAQTGDFDDAEQWQFGWDKHYSRDQWLEQLPTFGGHGQLPPEELEPLLSGIGEVIDERGGSFTMHYIALVLAATRRPRS